MNDLIFAEEDPVNDNLADVVAGLPPVQDFALVYIVQADGGRRRMITPPASKLPYFLKINDKPCEHQAVDNTKDEDESEGESECTTTAKGRLTKAWLLLSAIMEDGPEIMVGDLHDAAARLANTNPNVRELLLRTAHGLAGVCQEVLDSLRSSAAQGSGRPEQERPDDEPEETNHQTGEEGPLRKRVKKTKLTDSLGGETL